MTIKPKEAETIKKLLIDYSYEPTMNIDENTEIIYSKYENFPVYGISVLKHDFMISFSDYKNNNMYAINYKDNLETMTDKKAFLNKLTELLGDISSVILALICKIGVNLND